MTVPDGSPVAPAENAVTGAPGASACAGVCDPYPVSRPNWKKTAPPIRVFGFAALPFSVAEDVPTSLAAPVAVDGGATSTAPISHAGPWGRPRPRWSVAGQPLPSPASIAGLPV